MLLLFLPLVIANEISCENYTNIDSCLANCSCSWCSTKSSSMSAAIASTSNAGPYCRQTTLIEGNCNEYQAAACYPNKDYSVVSFVLILCCFCLITGFLFMLCRLNVLACNSCYDCTQKFRSLRRLRGGNEIPYDIL